MVDHVLASVALGLSIGALTGVVVSLVIMWVWGT